MADEKLHEADQLRDEEDKGEDDESEEGVAKNFADNVTVQYAHERTVSVTRAKS